MEYEGTVSETPSGIAVQIRAAGTRGVPIAVEINLRDGGKLSGTQPLDDDRHLLRSGMAEYVVGNDTIRFGPGNAAHRYVQIRGADEKMTGPSVYLTGYTPFETTLQIDFS